jgi:hypothetical protein
MMMSDVSWAVIQILEENKMDLVARKVKGGLELAIVLCDGSEMIVSSGKTTASMATGRGTTEMATAVESIPHWLDKSAWERWVAHRKKIKKPLTRRAELGQISLLRDAMMAGHDPAAVIKTSLDQGWVGLFMPRKETQRSAASNAIDGFVERGPYGPSRQTLEHQR